MASKTSCGGFRIFNAALMVNIRSGILNLF
jgi:hypothetical protein